jgi:hypothetical protein
MAIGSTTTSMTPDAFPSLGARVTMASPGCSKPRAEDGLHIRNDNKSTYKEPRTIQAQKYSDNFFYFNALGTGAASKALVGSDLPTTGGVCLGEAIATVTKGNACLGVIVVVPVDGSTATEGTSCSFTVSSPTASSTLPWHALGLES